MISDYLHKKASANRVPLDGAFELSPVCNFFCKMCYVRKTNQQICAEGKRLKTMEEWLALAEQCRAAGTLYLLLTGGEPFLYPEFRELYTRLHQMGFILSINSNGSLIDEETVQWLKKYAPSRVNITLYGSSPATYERISGNSSGYEKAVNAITMLQEAGIPVVINASMIPENVCDLEAILDFGRGLGLNTRMSTYMFPPARRDRECDDSRFTAEEAAGIYLRKLKKIYKEDQYKAHARELLDKREELLQSETWGANAEYMRCRAGRSSFWVSWEGKMTACGMLDFPIRTDPFQERFLDCWLRLTDAVRTTEVLRGCAGCEKREACKPCVAMIYTETGTVDEKAPYLCEMAGCVLDRLSNELEDTEDAKCRKNE